MAGVDQISPPHPAPNAITQAYSHFTIEQCVLWNPLMVCLCVAAAIALLLLVPCCLPCVQLQGQHLQPAQLGGLFRR
jgi:hypothetical protein